MFRGDHSCVHNSDQASTFSVLCTQTLRQMERDGLITRTVHPVVPPKAEYKLTHLGLSLGAAFCGVWVWAAENLKYVEQARREFDGNAKTV